MGAIIKVHTDRVIEIEGVPTAARLHPPADPGPDRGGQLGLRRRWPPAATSTVRGARQADMMTFLNVFRSVGGEFEVDDDPGRAAASGSGTRAASCTPWRWRPTYTRAS